MAAKTPIIVASSSQQQREVAGRRLRPSGELARPRRRRITTGTSTTISAMHAPARCRRRRARSGRRSAGIQVDGRTSELEPGAAGVEGTVREHRSERPARRARRAPRCHRGERRRRAALRDGRPRVRPRQRASRQRADSSADQRGAPVSRRVAASVHHEPHRQQTPPTTSTAPPSMRERVRADEAGLQPAQPARAAAQRGGQAVDQPVDAAVVDVDQRPGQPDAGRAMNSASLIASP